jgi:hypothetical protein
MLTVLSYSAHCPHVSVRFSTNVFLNFIKYFIIEAKIA